jgi:hypothetical protein
MSYRILQLIKSVDDSQAVNTLKVRDFASVLWTRENKYLCDYLFVPSEKESTVLHTLLHEAAVKALA